MKKVLAIVLATAMTFSLVACSKSTPSVEENTESTVEESAETETEETT